MHIVIKLLKSFQALIICMLVVLYVDQRLTKQLPISFTGNTSGWQIGDLVLRMGKDVDSHIIAQASQSKYSHIGMVIAVVPEVKILHATTDDDPQYPNQVITTPLSAYLSSRFASAYAVLRPSFLSQEQRALMVANATQYLGTPFVLTDRTNHPFYCTTLVLQSIQHVDASFDLEWQRLDMPMFKGDYLFPNAYRTSQRFTLIEESVLLP